MYLPVEFLIIGTALTLHKKEVTNKEVAEYRKRCELSLEWGEELHFCDYNEENDTYVLHDNISLPPYILQILTKI